MEIIASTTSTGRVVIARTTGSSPVTEPTHQPPVVALADDLAGALELAEVAARHGLSAVIQSDFHPVPADVICVDMDTRWSGAENTAHRITTLIVRIAQSPFRWVFLRIDPRRCDKVVSAITTMAAAWPWSRALVVPILSGHGQAMQHGHLTGVPDADPQWPQVAAQLARLAIPVVLPTIAGSHDFPRLALQIDDQTLLAGSRDLFALRLVRYGTDRFTRGMRRLRRRRLWVNDEPTQAHGQTVRFTPHTPPAVIRNALEANGPVIIGDLDADTAGERLAELVLYLVEYDAVDHLLLTADATARMILRGCNWNHLRVTRRCGAGILDLLPTDDLFPSVLLKPPASPWSTRLFPTVGTCPRNAVTA